MKVKLVQMGKSKRARIPSAVVRECGFGEQVDRGVVILSAARNGRDGWDDAFATMAAAGDDHPLLPNGLATDFDSKEWTW